MLGTWLGVLLSISACLSPAHSAGVVSPVLTPTPRAGSPRRLLARAGGAAIQAEDVRSTYGITLTGSLTPIHTAQHLATVLQSAAPGTRLALMPQVSVSPCEPLAVPAGAHVTLDCGGGSIDLRCDGAGMLLGTDAKLELLQCHVLWPVLRPLFTQPDSSIILEEGASITQLQGSSSLHCKVRTCPFADLPGSAPPYFERRAPQMRSISCLVALVAVAHQAVMHPNVRAGDAGGGGAGPVGWPGPGHVRLCAEPHNAHSGLCGLGAHAGEHGVLHAAQRRHREH